MIERGIDIEQSAIKNKYPLRRLLIMLSLNVIYSFATSAFSISN